MLLTVEISPNGEEVEICCDQEGLELLRRELDSLGRTGGPVQLMTPSWAGYELTEEGQIRGYRLANHLKINLKPPGDPAMTKLLEVARAILKGEADLIDGACEIDSLRHCTPFAEDPIFHGFIVVSSDADDLHTAPSRDWWAPEALARIDKKRRDYIESTRESVLEDCRRLLERFGSQR